MIKINQLFIRLLVAAIAFVIGILFVLLINFAPQIVTTKSAEEEIIAFSSDRDEVYAIYSIILDALGEKELFVVGEMTNGDYSLNYPDDVWRRSFDLRDETVGDFKLKNLQKFKLTNEFPTKTQIYFLSLEEEKRLFPKGGAGWERFNQKFPQVKGIFYLSNVGFNKERTEALIQVTSQGQRSGEDFYSLKKLGGKWMIWHRSHGI